MLTSSSLPGGLWLEDAPSDEVVLEVMALAAEFLSYVEEEWASAPLLRKRETGICSACCAPVMWG